MADATQVKSKRDLFGERLKNKYPDREYADDEALFGQINDDYDEYDAQLDGYRKSEKKFTDLLSDNPHSARFITDMANGVNPWVALVEQLGMDGITDILENPQYKEELAKAQAEYQKNLARGKELEEEYRKNISESLELFRQMQETEGVTDEEIDSEVDLLMKIANEAIVGKFTRESLEMARKALHHDADMGTARMEGEVAGKNAKVEAQLRKPVRSDGTATLGGANNAPAPMRNNDSIFDVADGAQ